MTNREYLLNKMQNMSDEEFAKNIALPRELREQNKCYVSDVVDWLKAEKESKVWKPEGGEKYHCVDCDGSIYTKFSLDNDFDKEAYELGNCFKTYEEAEAISVKIKIYTQLKRLAEELNTEPIDWKNENQSKWYIGYDYQENELSRCYARIIRYQGTIYCTNPNFLEIAKERIGEENLLKLFK